ncbi:MAG: phosphoribosylformylglycinamidine synthase subunit PurQ, partial [Flavobacterium sp.]|nr:phosphoribosylformylglycinamidine synthase subunit PurQ [Flavobacterium sp.]
ILTEVNYSYGNMKEWIKYEYGSDFNSAMMCDTTGRHLVMMPHIERSTFPWNWANYPERGQKDEVSPWLEAFVNARKWIENKK